MKFDLIAPYFGSQWLCAIIASALKADAQPGIILASVSILNFYTRAATTVAALYLHVLFSPKLDIPTSRKMVQVVNVDMFETSRERIQQYKSWGKNVSCYFSAGTAEDWRADVQQNKFGSLAESYCAISVIQSLVHFLP